MAFEIDLPALSRGLLDRSENVRDPERVAAAWPSARILRVAAGGRFPLVSDAGGTRLALADAAAFGPVPPPGAVLLGSLGGTHYWALATAGPVAAPESPAASAPVGAPGPAVGSPGPAVGSPPAAPGPVADAPPVGAAGDTGRPARITSGTIRSAGPLLGDDEAALATTAVALLGWHASAGFCSRCGLPTEADATGHSRSCPAGHQEFPRTDPAVIVLVHDGAGNAVLARQPSWEPGRFSVLAGFAEAGESLEATVAREIWEEVGVRVDGVQYLGSQPWPFPRSLMIAFAAIAPRGAVLRPRAGEIEQARWFSRERLTALLSDAGWRPPAADASAGAGADGERPGTVGAAGPGAVGAAGVPAGRITLPGSVSIARRMLEGFVRAG